MASPVFLLVQGFFKAQLYLTHYNGTGRVKGENNIHTRLQLSSTASKSRELRDHIAAVWSVLCPLESESGDYSSLLSPSSTHWSTGLMRGRVLLSALH